jgi:hypothetical protein
MTRAPLEAWAAPPVKGLSWPCTRPRRTPAQAPWPLGRCAGLPGHGLTAPAFPQRPISPPSPLLPSRAAALAAAPGVPCLAQRLGLGNTHGRVPPLEVLSQVGHETPQGDAACPACALTALLVARLQGCPTPRASRRSAPGAGAAPERPTPGAIHSALRPITRALQWSFAAPGHTGQHAWPRSGAFPGDMAIVRVTPAPVAAALHRLVATVPQAGGSAGRQRPPLGGIRMKR